MGREGGAANLILRYGRNQSVLCRGNLHQVCANYQNLVGKMREKTGHIPSGRVIRRSG